MITDRDLERLTPPGPGREGSVVSIGVFDGVHLGHQAILEANVRQARERGAEAVVFTFRTHPKELLLGRAPRTLTTLEHRLTLFGRAGVDHVVALAFDEELRSMPAGVFLERVVEGLDVRHFVLGFDSKFGRDRQGTPELVRSLGYSVEVVPKVKVGERAVSSTAVREAVELGDLTTARAMLGRRVSVFGRVVHGSHMGREIGFPTANLDLHHELHPPPGVYACRVHHIPAAPDAPPRSYDGVCNIGFRPTVATEKPTHPLVEVHLLDFTGDLYGERIELEFVVHLRSEKRFDGLEALRSQIQDDTRAARKVLSS